MTPRTDALYFPLGKEHTTVKQPTFIDGYNHAALLETELTAANADIVRANRAVEILAAWMIGRGFAVGHGETIDDLLYELSWQIAELKVKEHAPAKEPT